MAEFKRNRLFEGRDPDKLTTYITHDVAPDEIEISLLDTFELGNDHLRNFLTSRFVGTGEDNKPAILFSSTVK